MMVTWVFCVGAIVLSCASLLGCYALTKQVEAAIQQMQTARQERAEIEDVLVDVLDADGEIRAQLALPGKRPDELKVLNHTPCGAMCARSHWHDSTSTPAWRCTANQGKPVDPSREMFRDEEGQCSMYRASDFAKETDQS